MNTYNVLIISYTFTPSGTIISASWLGPIIKNYYEQNSRGKIIINITNYMSILNQSPEDLDKAVETTNNQIDNKYGLTKFHFRMHFCNPSMSSTANNQSILYNSKISALHSFGHLMGLEHADQLHSNADGTTSIIKEGDFFDCMVKCGNFSGNCYESLNPVHRQYKGWYLPGDLVEAKDSQKYCLAMLKNFNNGHDTKVLTFLSESGQRYWISYGHLFGSRQVLIVHTSSSDLKHSYLVGCYNAYERTIKHEVSGTFLTIHDITDDFIVVSFELLPEGTPVTSDNLLLNNREDDDVEVYMCKCQNQNLEL